MKEEGKRSKSASPVVNGPEIVKLEKRKPEDEVDDEDLSKRARLAAGVEAEGSSIPPPQSQPVSAESTQTNPELVTPTLEPIAETSIPVQESEPVPPAIMNITEEPVVKQEIVEGGAEPAPVHEGTDVDVDEDEDAVDSSVLVKAEPESSSDL